MSLAELTGQYRIVMCGCHEAGWPTIRFLLEQGVRFAYFVTLTPELAGRNKVSGYCSFADLASEFDVPVYYVESYTLKSENDRRFFAEQRFDLLVQGGWQRLFPEQVLQTLRIGAIGGHGSADLLPRGRGRSPVNWSLIEGKQRFLMHYFLIRPGVDDGDIFHLEPVDITPWDTCRTLYYKLSILTQRTLLEFIPKLLAEDVKFWPQVGEASYYPKRSPEDGLIDWQKTVFEIHNQIRALSHPYPGAFSYLGNEKIYFWSAQPFDTRIIYPQAMLGEIVEIFPTGDFVVNCSAGLLLVTEYQGTISKHGVFGMVSGLEPV